MRCLKLFCFCLVMGGWLARPAEAAPYQPFEWDGRTVNARPVSYKDTHIQLALEGGGYTNVAWGRLSQQTLRSLLKLKFYSAYAAPFIDAPPQAPPSGPGKIVIQPVERLDRPTDGSLFASPVMWFILLLLYAANIYAGYEIALFRHQNVATVCGVAAVAPILGPVIFLAMPTKEEPVEEEEVIEETEVAPELAAGEAAPAEAVAEQEPVAPAAPQHTVTVYQRGQTTFNRRFFETKLAGFLKVVPGEAEKDMVVVISSARGAHVGNRFTRISPNDLTLHVIKGNASQDVVIPFSEINEVKVQHKDAE